MQIGRLGAVALAKAVAGAANLERFDLDENQISEGGVDQVKVLFNPLNPGLTTVCKYNSVRHELATIVLTFWCGGCRACESIHNLLLYEQASTDFCLDFSAQYMYCRAFWLYGIQIG